MKFKIKYLAIFISILMVYSSGISSYAYDLSMNPDEMVDFNIPDYSVYRLLKISLQPIGNTMYVWGGGWNKADTAAGIEAVTLGVSNQWAEFAKKQNANYDFNQTRYEIHNGLDCSGYVGWVIYNFLHTVNGVEGEGYVMKARKMAKTFAQKGWGRFTPASRVDDYKAGDIMSGKGHVYIVIGECEDGSIVVAHASPPVVQLCGTVNKQGSQHSQAAKLADYYMKKYYPEWYRKYKPRVRNQNYLKSYNQMRWNTADGFWMQDKEGLQTMNAKQVLQIILGE